MATGDYKGHPLQGEASQGGFTVEKGGNLRDHSGCKADPKAIAATVHYDGDYDAGAFKGTDTLKLAAQRDKINANPKTAGTYNSYKANNAPRVAEKEGNRAMRQQEDRSSGPAMKTSSEKSTKAAPAQDLLGVRG